MTGFIGERRNREVALVTDDFRLYHRLAPFFDAHGITVLGLRPGEDVPTSVRVLLDGPSGDARSIAVRARRESTLLAAFQALDGRRHVRETGRYHRVVFGVDPGHVLGLAVLADEEVLLAGEALSPEAAVDRLAAWRDGLEAATWELHVGDGDPQVGREVLGLAAERLPGVRPSMVSEEATTPWSPATGSRHADAAILIARRRP